MELESLHTYLRQKKGATEELPFGPDALVFKIMGKMFAPVAWEETALPILLKCHPEHTRVLCAIYKAVQPGYHINKEHWNSIILDDSIPDDEILAMIDDSYN